MAISRWRQPTLEEINWVVSLVIEKWPPTYHIAAAQSATAIMRTVHGRRQLSPTRAAIQRAIKGVSGRAA
jgi:hypothetical protein